MKKLKVPLALLLLLLTPQLLPAQSRWQAALDRYERICGECLELRAQAAAGNSVPVESVTELLKEFSSLREMLRMAEGQMSPDEKLRFQLIRQRYAPLFPGKSPSQLPLEPLATAPPEVRLEPPSSLPRSFRPDAAPFSRQVSGPSSAHLQERPWHTGVVALCGFPELSPGLMLLLSKGPFGAYLKGCTSVSHPSSTGTCLSDGTSGDGYIWTTGESVQTRTAVSAGAFFLALPFAGIYAGAGRASRNLYWQEASGDWFKVSDLSFTGLTAEAGLVVPIRHFVITAGISTVSFKTVGAEAGVGFRF